MSQDYFTQVGEIRVHHKQAGEGKPLLFLHGWDGQADSFAPISQAFAAKRRVYSLDFPGFGKSDTPSVPWDVTDYMNCLDKWMGMQNLSGCDIIAHSFGCRVSILLAATHPERVGKLVFTGAAGLIPKRKASYYVKVYSYKCMKRIAKQAGFSRFLKSLGWDVEAKIRARAGSSDYRALPEVMRGTFVKVVNQDLKGYLKDVKASTLLIWGENDTETPLYFGNIMAEGIPDAGLVVFQNAGHFAYLEKSGDFIRIARVFLEGE